MDLKRSEIITAGSDSVKSTPRTRFIDWCNEMGYVPCSVTLDYFNNLLKGFEDMTEQEFRKCIDWFTYINSGKRVNANAMDTLMAHRYRVDKTTVEIDPNEERVVDTVSYDYED